MEIRDYVRGRPRGSVLVVVTTVLAAAVAWAVVRDRPQFYVASTMVTVPATGQSVGEVGLYVADWAEAIRSRDVTATVTQETGVSAGDYQEGIEAERVGQSSLINVRFTSPKRDSAQRVAEVAAETTLQTLAGPELTIARQVARAAESDHRQAQAAVDELTDRADMLFPVDRYREALRSLESSELQLQEAEARGDAVMVEVLEDRMRVQRRRVAAAERVVDEYLPLNDNLQAAAAARNEAQSRLTEAELSYDRATSPRLIDPVRVETWSRERVVVQAVGVAAVVAFLLALGSLALVEVLKAGASATERASPVTTRLP